MFLLAHARRARHKYLPSAMVRPTPRPCAQTLYGRLLKGNARVCTIPISASALPSRRTGAKLARGNGRDRQAPGELSQSSGAESARVTEGAMPPSTSEPTPSAGPATTSGNPPRTGTGAHYSGSQVGALAPRAAATGDCSPARYGVYCPTARPRTVAPAVPVTTCCSPHRSVSADPT